MCLQPARLRLLCTILPIGCIILPIGCIILPACKTPPSGSCRCATCKVVFFDFTVRHHRLAVVGVLRGKVGNTDHTKLGKTLPSGRKKKY